MCDFKLYTEDKGIWDKPKKQRVISHILKYDIAKSSPQKVRLGRGTERHKKRSREKIQKVKLSEARPLEHFGP